MNRRRFLQGLLAVPCLGVPLLVPECVYASEFQWYCEEVAARHEREAFDYQQFFEGQRFAMLNAAKRAYARPEGIQTWEVGDTWRL